MLSCRQVVRGPRLLPAPKRAQDRLLTQSIAQPVEALSRSYVAVIGT
jgi:hypothetical protein